MKRNLSIVAVVLGLITVAVAYQFGGNADRQQSLTALSSFVQTSVGLICLASFGLFHQWKAGQAASLSTRAAAISGLGFDGNGQFSPSAQPGFSC